MKNISTDTVAICGLFCARCTAYPKDCDGCLSDRTLPYCTECPDGFRSCAAEHHIARCAECPDFPCDRLAVFKKTYIHHRNVDADIECVRRIGVEKFITEKVKENTCPNCGALLKWDMGDGEFCAACGYRK
jgi:hypothetical protein